MKNLVFFTLFVGIVALFSCKKNIPTPAVSFSPATLERQGGPDCATEEGRCVRLEMIYPLASGTNELLAQKINDTLQQTLAQILFMLNPEGDSTHNIEQLADQFISSYSSFIQEVPDYSAGWWIESSHEVHRNTGKVVSIELMVSSFTGGAHPLGFSETFNFFVPEGTPVTLDKLITDQEGFLALVEKEFKLTRGLPESANLQDEGFFYNEAFVLPTNFVFTEEGLYLIYNVYDVAPYVMGPTEILIPYTKLEGLLQVDQVL
ncbi:MAG: DUF3298 and DUF4163 domain-containing protein [Saprospirales bacterium]|nr:DUF3298 and DUF4163 domain-containing protein [Saprospirales bacterium]